MNRRYKITVFLLLSLAACSREAPEPVAARSSSPQTNQTDNPLLTPSPLPFQAPPFDRIKDEHYQPALESGIERKLAEIEAIASSKEPPTFANTIEAIERSGELLDRARAIFFSVSQADTNDTLQKIESEIAPKLAGLRDTIFMNEKLFARVKVVYDQRQSLGLDPEATQLLDRTYRFFLRSGVQLSEGDKTKLRALNQEESKLKTDFENRLLAATNAGAIIVDDKTQLDGLNDADLAATAERAKDRKLEGKWVLVLRNTTQQPMLSSLKNRELRQRFLESSTSRASRAGDDDTRAIAQRLAQLRADKAKLLGFSTYAAWVLDDQMAKTPEAAIELLTNLVPAATARARAEAAMMQKRIDSQNGGFRLTAADWDFYGEQVRKAEYDLDESEVKPYLELERVLQDGVFFAANRLYGLTFRERKDLPVYHPDVRVWDVIDADGSQLAIFYGDFYARPSKSGGAWMDNFVPQNGLTGTKPVVFNVTNFTKPAPGQPALISWDDVATLFHEFGHALHGMFSNTRYASLSGVNVSNDYGEFPSQVYEHWALDPTVFANYAKHHKTGEPMPLALAGKIRKSQTFNQGYATTEYLASSLLDLAWHTLPAASALQDTTRFEAEALKRFRLDMPEVPPRYRTTYFSHIFGGDYAAAYYAYLWSEVIGDDAYAWFRENGGLSRANGDHFRKMILSRGKSEDEGAMYRKFRGRDAIVDPLLERRGLKTAK